MPAASAVGAEVGGGACVQRDMKRLLDFQLTHWKIRGSFTETGSTEGGAGGSRSGKQLDLV